MSSSNTYDSHIIKLIRRTENVLSLRFENPSGFKYKAGQFMFITYEAPQGKRRKHVTISSSPTESFLEISKRLTGSDFSNGLLLKEPRDRVRLEGPYGDFVAEKGIMNLGMKIKTLKITNNFILANCIFSAFLHSR